MLRRPPMRSLNYHHLLHFQAVAREGGFSRASRKIGVSTPTLSEQVRALEDSLGGPLLVRGGRGLALTELGRAVLRHAEEIAGLGRAVLDLGHGAQRAPALSVGVTDAMPKFVVHRLLAPALAIADAPRLVLREGPHDRLLADLAVHALDLVLSDLPMAPSAKVRAFNHPLGESDLTFVGAEALVHAHPGAFPSCLDGAPVLLPGEDASLRRALDTWFDAVGVRPRVVAECDDSALIKAFGASGAGFFAVPTFVAAQVRRSYQVKTLGRVPAVREHYVAITLDRRLKNPAVAAVCAQARQRLQGVAVRAAPSPRR